MAQHSIPEVTLSSGNGKKMPVLGLGTGTYPFPAPEVVIKAVLKAIEFGYRMFNTASIYQTEESLGEAISQALTLGLTKSRDEVFITSKLWCTDNHGHLVLPALLQTLQNMKLGYLDQYLLVHMPATTNLGAANFPPKPEDIIPMDIRSVWIPMEECQTLGLTKLIGVSNFSCKILVDILAFSKIPQAVKQVMNPS
ncbi:NADPH-dependent codeinone reductase 1-4-like [Apium graveolens]|uniref:NADPH-dependent codeinone reductase 1-4-like n=1 Tax=Apium graveolens TaxID=4045 RepID=UPI003D7986AA